MADEPITLEFLARQTDRALEHLDAIKHQMTVLIRIASRLLGRYREAEHHMIDVRKASPGTVSHGTLRPLDLLESFANELEHQVRRNAEAWRGEAGGAERDRLVNLVTEAREFNADNHLDPRAIEPLAGDLADALAEELQMFAPDGHYFGAHPGDGSDFGYWEDD